ncbi:MAG: hypothetical protein R3B40_07100 [Polyangiales bacterium]|nr:hypothetical protein [Myxococcales bacterium]MCB9657699.1 hypothetical protein [Sandaracinaceae bacterium]
MDFDQLRNLIKSSPRSTGPDIDQRAREWLATADVEVTAGPEDGAPIVLAVLGVDEDCEARIFALPAGLLDEQAHADLAAVHGRYFEWFFTADLAPEQFAGAFRFCSGSSTEPDIFAEQVEELRGDVEAEGLEIDLDALVASAGAWNEHAIASGATLSGPITHVYTANLCM